MLITDTVGVTDYEARLHIPFLDSFALHWPDLVERFLRYLFSISGALGLLNMAPVFWLDGQYSTLAFIWFFFPSVDEETRAAICKYLLITVSLLFLLNILMSLYSLFLR